AHEVEMEIHQAAGHDREPLAWPVDGAAKDFSSQSSVQQDAYSLLRIIDACANRAAEGLRVIEDYVRFVLDDRNLTSLIKTIRHDLTTALEPWQKLPRLIARETLADVGTDTKTTAELTRADLTVVVTASFQRVEQSL